MSNKQIKIEYTALENLNPYKGNPKVHDEKQIQQIAKSIERFGFNNPILIDEKSGGNCRSWPSVGRKAIETRNSSSGSPYTSF